ncbi:uncharacterized protein LY89DRAFT_692479 [Mollisia scopiformis]|uniref:2EXR domain-containing protein n=1 Tax=Mollisia scopiformis TaxID=149040 RepID=A0A132B3K2_MOLSC|nr:uncharacterized protein LY89DRAFT_692479 [Mollisia scopiformis]KUJ06504.1 hypothetical protein LY89DRAFT_692479 [Mollisia scopiformis]
MSDSSEYCGDTFERFNDLSIELHSRVWKMASFIPRTVSIESDMRFSNRHNIDMPHDMPTAYTTSSGVPAILHVCQESRNEALKHYSLELGSHLELSTRGSIGRRYTFFIPPTIYINWTVDTLYVPRVIELIYEDSPNFVELFESRGLTSLALYADAEMVDFAFSILPVRGALKEIILLSCSADLAEKLGIIDFVDIKEIPQDPDWRKIGGLIENPEGQGAWNSMLEGDHRDLLAYLGYPSSERTTSLPKLRLCEVKR